MFSVFFSLLQMTNYAKLTCCTTLARCYKEIIIIIILSEYLA